jgi:uncharacterized phage-associated protein
MLILFPFKPLKTIQASAVLLKTTAARRMSRLRLLKLLYIADRECLKEFGQPITGDRAVAMKNGPVLTHTYDLIKGQDFAATEWEKFFRPSGKRDIELTADPGLGKLSQSEISKLQAIAQQFEDEDDWAVAEFTHTFPEWIKNKPANNSSKPIPLDDVLEAVGLISHKQELIQAARGVAAVHQLFAKSRT